LQNHYLS